MGLNGGSPLLQTEPFAWRQRPTPGMAAGRGNRCYIQDGGRPRQPLLCTRWRRAARSIRGRMRRAPSRPPRPPHTRGSLRAPLGLGGAAWGSPAPTCPVPRCLQHGRVPAGCTRAGTAGLWRRGTAPHLRWQSGEPRRNPSVAIKNTCPALWCIKENVPCYKLKSSSFLYVIWLWRAYSPQLFNSAVRGFGLQ